MNQSTRENKGRFIKDFTSHPEYPPGCRYQIDLIEGCSSHCAYCFLDDYLNADPIVIFSNPMDLEKELQESSGDEFNLTVTCDGSMLPLLKDDISVVFKMLSRFPQKTFEIRFKSSGVLELLKFSPPENIVFTSTISGYSISHYLEKGTSSVDQRISALQEFQQNGYRVGVILDPVILYDDWEKEYIQVFRSIESAFDHIDRLGIGLLRLTKGMKDIFLQRVSQTPMRGRLRGEFFLGEDGKYRYVFTERQKAYKKLKEMSVNINAEKRIVFMENPDAGKEFLP